MGLLKTGAAARWHPYDKAVSRCPHPQKWPEYEYTDTLPTLPIICPLCATNRNAFATHDVQLQASLYSFVGSVGIVVAVRAYKH